MKWDILGFVGGLGRMIRENGGRGGMKDVVERMGEGLVEMVETEAFKLEVAEGTLTRYWMKRGEGERLVN